VWGPRTLWTPYQGGLSHATPLGVCDVSGHSASPAHAGGGVAPDRGFPPRIPHLRARVSWARGRCLATPPLGHRGNPPRASLSACPWGPAPGLHTGVEPRMYGAG